jgi:hypothetical protein
VEFGVSGGHLGGVAGVGVDFVADVEVVEARVVDEGGGLGEDAGVFEGGLDEGVRGRGARGRRSRW